MPATVIMVHDDPKFVEEAAAALRSAGHQIATFADPNEALSALEDTAFKILVTRVWFPALGRSKRRCVGTVGAQ